MKQRFTQALVAVVALAGVSAACTRDEDAKHEDPIAEHTSPPEGPKVENESAPALNAMQHEMRLLLAALQGSIAAIADDDLERIPTLFHGIHDARSATDAAIAAGGYRPPRNPDQMASFKAMDTAFHDALGVLVKAAQRDDLEATTAALSQVLNRCNGCHTVFRETSPQTVGPAQHAGHAIGAVDGGQKANEHEGH